MKEQTLEKCLDLCLKCEKKFKNDLLLLFINVTYQCNRTSVTPSPHKLKISPVTNSNCYYQVGSASYMLNLHYLLKGLTTALEGMVLHYYYLYFTTEKHREVK